ncbi:hypothetical protein TGRUB_235460 [Toxoplasma gondii RUB]|uniref:Uncharacterized protein n=3 Tax=Toxoplasma gondii TaxID=5811 RepID=S7URS1_TOXGG|nr:hypothetical protein TGGT1_235460 [Toxoplasma gondii GT1]KFG62497.1 hypothetical protein TGRUB_235460 [Toxoplasma gondii RUB]KFH00286.1 hypothetical protein TGVAND_235460 [Toxoplasma gondii VAND]
MDFHGVEQQRNFGEVKVSGSSGWHCRLHHGHDRENCPSSCWRVRRSRRRLEKVESSHAGRSAKLDGGSGVHISEKGASRASTCFARCRSFDPFGGQETWVVLTVCTRKPLVGDRVLGGRLCKGDSPKALSEFRRQAQDFSACAAEKFADSAETASEKLPATFRLTRGCLWMLGKDLLLFPLARKLERC